MGKKQSKRKQGYTETEKCCESCAHTSVKVSYDRRGVLFVQDNHRCGLGRFKVKLNGTCLEYEKAICHLR